MWKDTQYIVAWIAPGVPKPEQWVGLTQESWSPETRPVGEWLGWGVLTANPVEGTVQTKGKSMDLE